MTDGEPTVFPQHKTRRPKSELDRIDNILVNDLSTEAAAQYILAEFPGKSPEELQELLQQAGKRAKAQTDRAEHDLKGIEAAMDMMAKAAAQTGRDDLTVGEAMQALADSGDETAAAFLKSRLPEIRFQEALMELAVERDPFWEKDGHTYVRKEGATHEEPEELIAAFLESHGDELVELLPEDIKEWAVEELIRDEVEKEFARLVATGELERHERDDGEVYYKSTH